METVPEMEATTLDPLGKLTGICTMFLYSMNNEMLKVIWSVTLVLRIQRVGFLPLALVEWEFRIKGEVEMELAWELSFDC